MKKFAFLTTMLMLVSTSLFLTSCKKDSPKPPYADFTIAGDNNPAPCQVFFTNLSTDATTFLWEFGDGTTSTSFSPSHVYLSSGTYNAKLTAVGPGGTNSFYQSVIVKLPEPTADFLVTGDNGTVPCVVSFTNTSLNATSFYWDFDDGTSSTTQNPSHVFTAAGTYHVTLTAQNESGSNTVFYGLHLYNSGGGTDVTFNNPVFTDIYISMNGSTQMISPGGSVTFYNVAGYSASYYAFTSGSSTSGTQIGQLIEWNHSITLNGGSLSYNLIVSSDYFFLYLKNSGYHTLTPLYVNYGLSSETVDYISIPANNVKYSIGYYKAWTNTQVRAYYEDSPSAYTYWQNLNLPWTNNQYIVLTNTFKSLSGTGGSNTQTVSPLMAPEAKDIIKTPAFNKHAVDVKCK